MDEDAVSDCGAHGRLASAAEDADVETSRRETLRATCWPTRLHLPMLEGH